MPEINDSDFSGVVSDSNKYEGRINHIEISHERTRTPEEPLTEAEQSTSRSELWKLMRSARIARPGAVYDASAAAQTFSDGEIIEFLEKGMKFWKMGRKISRVVKKKKIPNTCRDLPNS